MYAATRSFANMIKVGNVIDHAIKNGKIDLGESSSKPKRGGLPKKKKGETQAVYKRNPEDMPRTKIIPIISPITQPRVIWCLPWLPILPLQITKPRPYKHARQFQIANQTLQGIITLQIIRPTIIHDL